MDDPSPGLSPEQYTQSQGKLRKSKRRTTTLSNAPHHVTPRLEGTLSQWFRVHSENKANEKAQKINPGLSTYTHSFFDR